MKGARPVTAMSMPTKPGVPIAVALIAGVLGVVAPGHASDHIDGLKTALDNAADLTDLYVFTSPRDPDRLVLVMSSHGVAFSGSRFSNAVDYKFRIRPIEDETTLAPSADASREQSIVCRFSGGAAWDPNQKADCSFDLATGTETVSFDTRSGAYRAGGDGQSGSTRVFAGVRSDSWFLDLGRTLKFNAGLPVSTSPGINGLWGQNVLSIVVELDKQKLGGPLLAVTTQTVRR